ncbi:MAG: MraY family glycosyltransferase, partial [Solirubrobacteraceae bacterium]
LGAVAVLVVVGTIDDRRTVSPQLRVVCEFGLGAWLAAVNLGWQLGSGGALDAVVTGLWVVGLVNAFNLFDNMDGASSTMALVASGGICALGLVTGNAWVAAGSAALCGSCLGFLPHNLSSPAKIFLGDGGSMPLGFAVAVLAANAARSAEPGLLGLLVGFLLVGVPALDTTLVIVSRTRRGISVLTAGLDHLTHRTRMRMKTPRRVDLVLGLVQALISALVILATRAGSPALVYCVLAFVVLAVAAIVALEDAIPREGVTTASVLGNGGAVSQAHQKWIKPIPSAVLGVIGLGAGLSPLFSAYYSPGIWVPVGLVLVVAAAAGVIARPPRTALPVVLLVLGVAGLGLWSLLSMSWAQAVEQATVGANLWLAYAALIVVLVTLLSRRRRAVLLLGCAGLGIVVVAISVLVRLLGSDPSTLFIAGRLNSPLGYINGEACVFAMGAWFGLALAERRKPLLAGVGAATAVVMAGLALLSQSRGAAIATGVAIVLALVAIPGWRRRVLALAVIAAALVAASGALLNVYTVGANGGVTATVAHHAVLAIVVAAVGAGVVWGALVMAANLARGRGGPMQIAFARAATVAAVAVIVVPLAAAVIRAPALERTVSSQWHSFVQLSASSSAANAVSGTQTRLFSGAGNRYDYWRVAWHTFTSHPVLGVGAGNFPAYYFRARGTQEAIQNPHSLEMQTLSELGVVGVLLLLLVIGGLVLGAARLRREAQSSTAARGLMVAALGVTVVWLVDTSGDWMHLLPGVTAIGLAAIAVLCCSGETEAARSALQPPRTRIQQAESPRRLPALLAGAAVIFVLAVGGASLLRSGLARHYVNAAQADLHGHPQAAIASAETALSLDSANLDAYYIKAAGQARFDRAAAARATLLAAVRQDPGSFITWSLLGDLEVRAGNAHAARSYYRRALALDPREVSLQTLVSEPDRQLLQTAR